MEKPVTCHFITLTLYLGLLCLAAGTAAVEPPQLTDLSLEDLMDMEVVSAAKKTQKLSQASAAVYVITAEDIRRSGATSIAEALRLAPGVNVARITSNQWAISIRGFNSLYSNKLLVLIDGRSVYSPFFSGVHWDIQDMVLADIKRIEVIRGPGATLWGANAVNGVINILTKRADETAGLYAQALAGDREQGTLSVRYGGRLGDKGAFRVYGKSFRRDEFDLSSGDGGKDDWDVTRGGFRLDWQHSLRDQITLSANGYSGRSGEIVSVPVLTAPYTNQFEDDLDISGGDLYLRWTRHISETHSYHVQFYYETLDRVDDVFDEKMNIADIEFQQSMLVGARHEVIWGLEYRTVNDQTTGSFAYSVTPDSRTTQLSSLFAQDNIALFADRMLLTAGIKFEHQDYTGTEVQPNLRAIWQFTDRHSVWSAVSHAVRTPSRNDNDVRINFSAFPTNNFTPGLVSIFGNTGLNAEDLTTYELGYRGKLSDRLAIDVTAFFNSYDDLLDTAAETPYFENDPQPGHMVFPSRYNNAAAANARGLEALLNASVTPALRLVAGSALLDLDVESDSAFTRSTAANTPDSQHQLRLYWDITPAVEFDAMFFYTNKLANQGVDAYTRADFRLGWTVTPKLNVSGVVQNAFDDRHPEFGSVPFTLASEVPRGAYVSITYQ